MTPEIVGTLILTCGGLLLAFAAVIVSRNATRWPEIAARLGQCEITAEANARLAKEAHEVALKARRVVSTRAAKRAATVPDESQMELPMAAPRAPTGPRPWMPGVAADGRPYEGGTAPNEPTAPYPTEFAD